MPQKPQKPLGVVPLGGFAAIPTLDRRNIASICKQYELPLAETTQRFESLTFDWKMNASRYSAAGDLVTAKAFERLVKSAKQLRQVWDDLENRVDENMIGAHERVTRADYRSVTAYDKLGNIHSSIVQLAGMHGLTDIEAFSGWLRFLSELTSRKIGLQTASPRQKKFVPLRKLIKSLASYWAQQKQAVATAYWSDIEGRTRTNEGGAFVQDAAKLITGKRPTPDQLREALREADDAPTGDEITPVGDGSTP